MEKMDARYCTSGRKDVVYASNETNLLKKGEIHGRKYTFVAVYVYTEFRIYKNKK